MAETNNHAECTLFKLYNIRGASLPLHHRVGGSFHSAHSAHMRKNHCFVFEKRSKFVSSEISIGRSHESHCSTMSRKMVQGIHIERPCDRYS